MRYLVLILMFVISFFAACLSAATSDTELTKNNTVGEIKQVTVEEANEAVRKENVQFIDVRTVEEYADKHASKAVNLPLDSLEKELATLDKEKPVYLICQSGARSQKGAEILQKAEFKKIYNVKGGTSAWTKANLPVEK
jgi:rhodanese-related sulfurtransferase